MSVNAQELLVLIGLIISTFGMRTGISLFRRTGLSERRLLTQAWKWTLALGVVTILFVTDIPLESVGWRFYPLPQFVTYTVAGLGIVFSTNIAVMLGMTKFAPMSVSPSQDPRSAQFSEQLTTAITAGVTEEVTFRGYTIEILARLTGTLWVGGGVSILAFALSHHNSSRGWSFTVHVVILATALTAIYVWTRSVPVLIAIHVLFDLIGLVAAGR